MKKKLLIISFAVLFAFIGFDSSSVKADSVMIVKVPAQARVLVNGIELDDNSTVSCEVTTEGRIHQMAFTDAGLVLGTKQCLVTGVDNLESITVYDGHNNLMYPTSTDMMNIDYTGVDFALDPQVVQRIYDSAIAFHHRIQYGSDKGFGSCFKRGSEGYNKAVKSDEGRKWGQFFTPGGFEKAEIREIHKYSQDVFSSRVTITCTESRGYIEQYDVYLLFQKEGNQFYVTNFTFQP